MIFCGWPSFKKKFRQLLMIPAHKLLNSALIGAESPDFRHGHRTEYSAHVFMSSMSTPALLDPAQFSLCRHGHPVQNGEIFFVSKSVSGEYEVLTMILLYLRQFSTWVYHTCSSTCSFSSVLISFDSDLMAVLRQKYFWYRFFFWLCSMMMVGLSSVPVF